MKILVLNKLSIFSLFIAIFFRIINFKIKFLLIKEYFQNKRLLKFLSKFNIQWFNYQDNIENNVKLEMMKSSKSSEPIANDISTKYWGKGLEEVFGNKFYLSACLNQYIYYQTEEIIEFLTVAKNFEKEGHKVFLWHPNNLIYRRINKELYNLKNLNILPNFNIPIFRIILKFTKKKINSLFLKFTTKKNINNNIKPTKKYDSFDIAYYPHHGMYYGEHYLKDYFYSYNEGDPFFYKKLIHIEWDFSNLSKNSKDYYNSNNINYLEWKSLTSNRNIIKKTLFFWGRNINIFFKLLICDLQILYFFLLSTFQILKSLENLEKLNNLKILLCCYDFLFPVELSIACKIKKIKTVAIQDKIYVSSTIPRFMFDFYFVSGDMSKNIFEKRMPNPFINNLRKMHVIKTDKYYTQKSHINHNKELSNYKFKCIVMDFHSFANWYNNGRTPLQNWRINADFYKIIINLAKNFPQIIFLIKSRDYGWINISFFKEIINEMENSKNILILQDQKKWTPIATLKVGDFAIAKPTSLAEEMLFINKPVIYYNRFGYPQNFFKLGEKLLADNYEEITEKLNLIINDYDQYNSDLDEERNKLFYKKEEGKLSSELNKIFNGSKL